MHQTSSFPATASTVAAAFVLVLTFVIPSDSLAQRWEWPERSENLTVLPADLSADRLRAVMRGFSRSLGVRCAHCHVGEEGQPLSTFDFASDDNSKKEVAREMLRMLGVINETLDGIEHSGPEPVNMWCHTCHRGVPRPMKLDEALHETYVLHGTDAMLAQYGDLREKYYGRSAYDFGEGSLNDLGTTLLQEGHADAAIAVLKLNAEQFPSSANVYDSLAEAYEASGQRDLAISMYEKSLEVDPGNRNASRKLRALQSSDQ